MQRCARLQTEPWARRPEWARRELTVVSGRGFGESLLEISETQTKQGEMQSSQEGLLEVEPVSWTRREGGIV